MNILNYLLRKYSKDNNLFSADPWIFQGYNQESKIGDSQIEFKEYRNFVLDSFHRNLKFFSNNNLPHTIEATSDKFFEIGGLIRRCADALYASADIIKNPPDPIVNKIERNCYNSNNKQLIDQAGQTFGRWWMFGLSEKYLKKSE